MTQLEPFAAAVLRERALLALVDPDGEADAVAPLTPVRARQIVLEAGEAAAKPRLIIGPGYRATAPSPAGTS